jgi:hypothetical protein
MGERALARKSGGKPAYFMKKVAKYMKKVCFF